MLRHLSDEDVRATLRRASEIAASDQTVTPSAEDELELYLKSAEEAGLPRAAVLQALQERLLAPAEEFAPGDLAFAPSVDSFAYVARIDKIESGKASVRFVHGGQHVVAVSELRPLALIPGRKIEADLGYGWTGAVVETVDATAKNKQVAVESWGQRKKLPLEKIRIKVEASEPPLVVAKQLLVRTALWAGTTGVALGWALHTLLR